MKFCGKCKRYKKMKEFSSHADTHDGKQSWCRKCQHKVYLKRYYGL